MSVSGLAPTDDDRRSLNLRVAEIAKGSAGRFMCRMNNKAIKELNLKPGEIIEVIGKKNTAAILFPSSDTQSDIIRIDGLTRRNAGVGIGEYVKVRKCNYKIANKVEQSISIPLINVIDETAKAVKTRNIKNIGLLGTKFTMEEDFYSEKLRRNFSLNPIIPKKQDRNFIHTVIYEEFAKGMFLDITKKKFLQIIKKLEDEGAEGIIMGCTEIPLLINQEDVDVPLFDTLKIHLSSAVEFCL